MDWYEEYEREQAEKASDALKGALATIPFSIIVIVIVIVLAYNWLKATFS